MKKQLVFALLVTSFAASAVLVSSCGKTDATSTTYSYAGPGSHYTITNSAGTYTITKYALTTSTTADFTVTATSVDINGFKKLTVTAVTGTGGPTVGSTVYGFEVPGMAIFLKPITSTPSDQVILAVASGTCPSSTLNMNWLKVKDTSGAASTNDTYGTFTYTTTSASSGTATLPSKYALNPINTAKTPNSFTAASCSGGIMSVSNGGGDNAIMYLTTSGGAIVNTAASSASSEFIFGLPQSSITPSTFAGTYSGLLYTNSGSVGSKLKAVKAVFTATSTALSGTGSEIDPNTDASTGGGTATITLNTMNSPSTGFMTGTLNTGSTTNLVCVGVANANGSGKQMIDCVSYDGTGLQNFMLVSR